MSSEAETRGGRGDGAGAGAPANAANAAGGEAGGLGVPAPSPNAAPLSATEAAEAAVAAADGGDEVAIVAVVDAPAERADALLGRRLLVDGAGGVRGTLGDAALDAAAADLARSAFGEPLPQTTEVEFEDGAYTLYAEAHRAPDELVVVGAGHIAVPLATLGVMLGFRTTVLDDREDFATAERFAHGARVMRADFSDPFRDVPIGPSTYLVLVTRAHKYDFDCLRDLVERDVRPAYIGMIGSRRRVKAAFRSLLDAGIPRDRLDRVHAPVGLDIGAETPNEIAVSIAAELVRMRRAGGGADAGAGPTGGSRAGRPAADAGGRRDATTLSEKERVLERLLPDRE